MKDYNLKQALVSRETKLSLTDEKILTAIN